MTAALRPLLAQPVMRWLGAAWSFPHPEYQYS